MHGSNGTHFGSEYFSVFHSSHLSVLSNISLAYRLPPSSAHRDTHSHAYAQIICLCLYWYRWSPLNPRDASWIPLPIPFSFIPPVPEPAVSSWYHSQKNYISIMSSCLAAIRPPLDIHSDPTNIQPPPVSNAAWDFRLLFAVQKLVHGIYGGGDTVTGMEDLSEHVHCVRLIHLSNGIRLLLKISPSTNTELLRHERHCLDAEAFTFSLLAKSKLPIPRVLRYDPRSVHLGSRFLLTTHLSGIPYVSARPYLTRSERSGIERQLDSLSSIITQHTSPRFGPVAAHKGYDTWREAFLSILESVLMDGEDKLVSLPYLQIREEALRFSGALDDVKQARLVIPGFGHPQNVLIDRRTNEVTGLTDFGKAMWADPEILTPGARHVPKCLL